MWIAFLMLLHLSSISSLMLVIVLFFHDRRPSLVNLSTVSCKTCFSSINTEFSSSAGEVISLHLSWTLRVICTSFSSLESFLSIFSICL
jgi:hypothetical protein